MYLLITKQNFSQKALYKQQMNPHKLFVLIWSTLSIPLFSCLCSLQFTCRKLFEPCLDSLCMAAQLYLISQVSTSTVNPSNLICEKLLGSMKGIPFFSVVLSISWSCTSLMLLRGQVLSPILKPYQLHFFIPSVIFI